MFLNLATRLQKEIQDVKSVVAWQEALRSSIHSPLGALTDIAIDPAAMAILKQLAPNKLAWQIFDHYAAVTFIYASFEKAICGLIEEYLGALPNICGAYVNLDEKLRVQHRIGVGQVLSKWNPDNPLYQALTEQSIASGLADGLRGQSYSILVEAFLMSPENFRANAIRKLFTTLGFGDAFASVVKSGSINDFLASRLSGAETPESFLDGFIRIRNEAAHGSGAGLASAKEIVNYADFVALVVDELANVLRTRALTLGVKTGASIVVGEVAHVYADNVVGVISSTTGSLAVGDQLFGGKKAILPITILSIRTGELSHPNITLTPGLEFGIKLDKKLSKTSQLFRWK